MGSVRRVMRACPLQKTVREDRNNMLTGRLRKQTRCHIGWRREAHEQAASRRDRGRGEAGLKPIVIMTDRDGVWSAHMRAGRDNEHTIHITVRG